MAPQVMLCACVQILTIIFCLPFHITPLNASNPLQATVSKLINLA